MTGINNTAMMTAMMSASTAMMQAQTRNSVRTSLNGRAGVLATEIELDGSRGNENGTSRKQEELSRIQQAAQNAAASQMDALNKANEIMKEAAWKDHEPEKNCVDQVELSQAGEKETKENQKTVAELPDTAGYNRDGSLIQQTASESTLSFGVTA